MPSHGILRSVRAPGVRYDGTIPSSPIFTEAIPWSQGQSSVKTTPSPPGVDTWHPTHCTSPGKNPGLPPPYSPRRSRPFSCRIPVNFTLFGASASITPSSPTLNPASLLESGPTADEVTVQNTIVPPAFTGAILTSPRCPIGVPGALVLTARMVTVMGLPG